MIDENIKNAFAKVKEDIDFLKKELEKQKKDYLEQKKILNDINNKLEIILKENNKKEDKTDIFNVSIGNKGVVDDRQLSMVDSRRLSTMIDDDQRLTTTKEGLTSLNQTLVFRFKTLTDREFSIFIAIYDLERQLGEGVTYIDLANKLNLTESSVKTHVNRILSKKIPISKERFFNRKSIISIKKGFKDPTIVAELIKMRQDPNSQTTLLDL